MPKLCYSPRAIVTKTIEEWIKKGILASELPLPTEDELSRNLNVSRGTLRSGLEILENKGLLYKQNGHRYIVRENQSQSPATPLEHTVLLLGVDIQNPMEFKDSGMLQAAQASVLESLISTRYNALSLHSERLEKQGLSNFLKLAPRGVVIFQELMKTELGLKTAKLVKQNGIPLVIEHDGVNVQKFDRVVYEHENSNYLLTEHFIKLGCRNILCFYPNGRSYWNEAKYSGYRKALAESRLTSMPEIDFCASINYYRRERKNFDEYVRLFAGFLIEHFNGSRPPDAILAPSDWDVPILASACRLFGRVPGQDILLGGYDNKAEMNPWAEFDNTYPAATVEKNTTESGRQLIALLNRRIDGALSKEAVKVSIPGKLIITNAKNIQ